MLTRNSKFLAAAVATCWCLGAQASVDSNNDGVADLVWYNTQTTASAFSLMGSTVNGQYQWWTPQGYTRMLDAGTVWKPVAVGKAGGGNPSSVFFQTTTTGETAMWLMNGDQQVGGRRLLAPNSGWSVKAVVDLDGDGDNDIVWENSDGSSAAWIMGAGTEQVGGARFMGPGSTWRMRFTGDFNGDGKADFVWENTANGQTAMWLMDGVTQIGGARLVNPPWHPVLSGDFNGDGKSDILFRNDNGALAVWFMNGAQQVGGGYIALPGSTITPLKALDLNGDGKTDLLLQRADGGIEAWTMDGLTISFTTNVENTCTGCTVVSTGLFTPPDKKEAFFIQKPDGSIRVYDIFEGTPQSLSSAEIIGVGTWTLVP